MAYLQPEWRLIYRRELSGYFNTPIGYVFAVASLFVNFLFFFLGFADLVPAFWESGRASVEGYMTLLPVTFIFLVPAITMRIWSEEYKSGTIETLVALPLRDVDIVAAKFLAAWSYVSLLVLASVPLALFIWLFGENFDPGSTFTMYVGSILMAGAYVSTGMLLSSFTREQIVAFILTFFASVFMFAINYFVISQHLPPSWAPVLGFFSHSYHYETFARCVIDLGDLFYYVSFILFMLAINVWFLRRKR